MLFLFSTVDTVLMPLDKVSICQNRNQIRRLKGIFGTSLVAHWLRICLPMQGTQVRALVWEDPTCRGATKPMLHNY